LKSISKKILSMVFLVLITASLLFGIIVPNTFLGYSNTPKTSNSIIKLPESVPLTCLGANSYSKTGTTQANLTCILNGTVNGDKTGFSIQVNKWNSTYINMTIPKVSLLKYLYSIEEGGVLGQQINTQEWVMGFNLTDSCILDAVDFGHITGLTAPPYTAVIIYNATYSAAKGNILPDKIIYNKNESRLPLLSYNWVSANAAPYWNGTLKVKPVLNITKTYAKTFFIRFSSNTTLFWIYNNDNTNGDQGLVYSGFGISWQNNTIDLTLRLRLSPVQSEKKPSEINMTINSKPVTNKGKWNTSDFIIPPPSGLIPFQVYSSWYNVSYRVNWTAQLNNITTAKTLVTAELLNKIVTWNVTVFATFLANSANRRINVTIPATWNVSKVFKGAIQYSNWVNVSRIPKKSVLIQSASTGIWVVQCKGYNWILNLTVYKQTIPVQQLYTLDTAKVAAQLIKPVNEAPNNAKLNITSSNQILLGALDGRGTGRFINITLNIAQYIHTTGRYKLVIGWFNGTEAGICNTTISIYNSTSLLIVSPEHKGTTIDVSRGEVFNLTLYYNMTFWKGAWSTLYLNQSMGASVKYKFMGYPTQPMNSIFIGVYAWTTTIFSPATYGSYLILINASAWQSVQNYTNYAITLRVKQTGTRLIFNDTAQEKFWKTPIAFSFTYTNLTGYPIQTENISIDWKYDYDSAYRGDLIRNFNYSVTYNTGTGVYTMLFANFSAHKYNLLFYIDANIYQAQEAYLTLIFTNITTSLTNQTIVPRLVYRQYGVVNVTICYKDLVNNVGIPTGVIQSNWSLTKNYVVQDLGAGYYKVSLNISKVFLNNYSVLLRASKLNYEIANLIIRLEIYGYPTIISNKNGANLTGSYAKIYAMDNWTFSFNYINASNGKGISGATITTSFGGHACVWRNAISGNYTIWADSNKLNAPMAEQNYTLQIFVGKSFYEQQVFTITVNILKIPTQIYPFQSVINAKIDDYIEVKVRLNDTHIYQGVNGLIWYKLQSITKQMQPTGTLGIYTTIVNLTNYSPGLYQIQLNSWAVDHQNATTTISLNVSRLNMFIITESSTISGYINDLLNVSIQLKDSKNRIVENLLVTYKIEALAIENTFLYSGNGFYIATIDLTGSSTISYQLKIESPLTSRYNSSRTSLTLNVNKIPTTLIPSKVNITGYYGEQYLLNARYLENVHGTYIDSATLQYQIAGKISPTILPFIGAGTYQTTLNFTAIGVGDYTIKIEAASSALYQSNNISIDLHIRAKIRTQLILYNPAREVEEGDIINVTAKLQTVSSVILKNQPIEWSTSIKFNNGSLLLFQQIKYTNNFGIRLFQYKVPNGASSIDFIANFAGATNLTEVWNTTSVKVLMVSYNLTLRVQSSVKVSEILLIEAHLSNATYSIGNALINFTIVVVYPGDVSQEILLWGITAVNGTVVVSYRVPSDVISLYIMGSYESKQGTVTNSDTKVVVAIDAWLIQLGKWLPIILLIVVIIIVAIFGVTAYYKVLKPKYTSIEERKRHLVQKRAENRRDIAKITGEIQLQREDTLKEAELTAQNMDFNKAAKLYEKAGNLTLEMADKTVAKEFFSKAKQMEERGSQKERQSEMKEQREKVLEAARVAIRERNVVEASRNYRQVAELSRMLGEREQAEKFLKLANAANERIIALKEGDMRKRSGEFLSKADRYMGKQDFIGAAENFEEAAKIMIVLGDEEGTFRFVNWAKLARERQSLITTKSREDWIQDLTQNQNELIRKAKDLVKERKYEEAVKIYTTLTIYAMELGKSDLIEKYKKDIDFYRNQASKVEISPESRSLIDERKKLLLNADDAIKNNRYSLAAKHFNRIAAITEMIDGKEAARTYLKQASYYASKVQERRLKEREGLEGLKIREKLEAEEVRPRGKESIEEVPEEEFEETKLELATTVKNARDALKTGKPVLAKDLYKKAANIAGTIGESDSVVRYEQKAEEIEIVQPKKSIEDEGAVRRKITELTSKAEKALQKKKYIEAKNLYEEISELFLQLGEEDAANSFFERASSLKRLI